MKIMSNRSYDAICDIVTDQSNQIKDKDDKNIRLWKTIDYLNSIIKARDKEILRLRRILNDHHISYKVNNIDFPATTKVEKPENKIF